MKTREQEAAHMYAVRLLMMWALWPSPVAARRPHQHWDAPPLALSMAGVTLGEDYPHPIVDHVKAREAALAALTTVSAKPGAATGAD
jgi:hypothetical protein